MISAADYRRTTCLLIFTLVYLLQPTKCFQLDECNVTRSCWHHPPNCGESCVSGVQWQMLPEGIFIQLEARVTDLDQTRPFYAALGFSFNQRMGDDTVIECVVPHSGDGKVQVSFNDETFNHVLAQATSVLITESTTAYVDGVITCTAKLLLDNRKLVDADSRFMIHDLEKDSYHLLFAKGNADVFTLEKDIHSTNDGVLFPWMSDDRISFCRANCSTGLFQVNSMRQTLNVDRYWRYRIAVWHGILLIFAWWVLASSGVLIARFLKPLMPRRKLLGTAVWFQLHRDLMIASLLLQIVCVFFIFYQAGWTWYECSYTCTSDDFAKKMHAITGFAATVLAVLQPLMALIRPSPSSEYRRYFNWSHWIVGMLAWALASATIVFGLPMGKTGLNRIYGHAPNWIVLGYLLFFVACYFILQIIDSSIRADQIGDSSIQPHRFTVGPNGMALADMQEPVKDAPAYVSQKIYTRVAIIIAHGVVSFAITITFAVLLLKVLWMHSV